MLLYLWQRSLHSTHLQDIAQVPVHLGRWNTFWTVHFPSVFNSSNEKTAKRYQNARCVIEILPWHIPNWPKVCEAGVALPSVSSCLNLRPVMSIQFPELTENNTTPGCEHFGHAHCLHGRIRMRPCRRANRLPQNVSTSFTSTGWRESRKPNSAKIMARVSGTSPAVCVDRGSGWREIRCPATSSPANWTDWWQDSDFWRSPVSRLLATVPARVLPIPPVTCSRWSV